MYWVLVGWGTSEVELSGSVGSSFGVIRLSVVPSPVISREEVGGDVTWVPRKLNAGALLRAKLLELVAVLSNAGSPSLLRPNFCG